VRWLLRDTYASLQHAPRVTAPTLLIAAEHDDIVPLRSTRQLAGSFAPGLATLRIVAGAGHNSISDSPAYPASLEWAR
jgi:pimeloyl-ACP methyl ester carboxylesterase